MWRKFIEWWAKEIFLFIPSAGLCGLWQIIFSKLATAVIPISHVLLQDDFVFFQSKMEFIDRLPTPVFLGFPCGSADKESTCNAGDLGSVPGLGRSPGERERLPTLIFCPREYCRLYQRIGHDWAIFTFSNCFKLNEPYDCFDQQNTRKRHCHRYELSF